MTSLTIVTLATEQVLVIMHNKAHSILDDVITVDVTVARRLFA